MTFIPPQNPQPISGTVDVGNFPATQDVSGAVSVDNLPAIQEVDGTVNVGNFPATQPVSQNSDWFILTGRVVTGSTTSTPLANGATFTGVSEDVSGYASLVVAAYTDKDGIGYGQFSSDNVNWDSAIPFSFKANKNEVHRYSVSRKYFRLVITNNSGSDMTVLRAQTLAGNQSTFTSALNSEIQADADAILVRPLDFNLMTAEGLYENRSNTIKSGLNFNVPAATSLSAPQDIHTVGGVYSGFPLSPVAGQITTNGTDAGTVLYSYMASATDTDYSFGSITISAGTNTYNLGHNIYRCNYAYFDGGSGVVTFNTGNITVQSVGGTNVFCRIDTGYSESQCSAYTVPYGSSVYLDMERSAMRGSSTGNMDGWWWYREYNKSPRLRWPFESQAGSLYFDEIDFLQKIPALTDVIPRITYSSANNQVVRFKYRFIKVKA